MCLFIKLGRHVHYDERMNPIEFGSRWSKVKVTTDIYGNKLLNTILNKPLCVSTSISADMLAIVRGWTLLLFERKKEEICLTQYHDKSPYTSRKSKGQSDNTNNATKKFDYTAVADRLRTVSCGNYGHPTGLVNRRSWGQRSRSQ